MDPHILKNTDTDFFMPHAGLHPVPVPEEPDDDPRTPYTMAEFQARVAKWRKEKIPNADLRGQLDKLDDEASELIEAVAVSGMDPAWLDKILREAADVCIVACNVADLAGLSFADALDEKQSRNEAKVWVEANGKAQHVGTEDAA